MKKIDTWIEVRQFVLEAARAAENTEPSEPSEPSEEGEDEHLLARQA